MFWVACGAARATTRKTWWQPQAGESRLSLRRRRWTPRCNSGLRGTARSVLAPGPPWKLRSPWKIQFCNAAAHFDIILIDCLTLWTANLMAAEGADVDRIFARAALLCEALRQVTSSVVLVSNEVGSGIVPESESGRLYRDLLGGMNQRVAAVADRVLLLVAGYPTDSEGFGGGAPMRPGAPFRPCTARCTAKMRPGKRCRVRHRRACLNFAGCRATRRQR